MSSRFLNVTGAAAIAAMLALSARQAFAQSDDADAEMRIQRLENQLRQLTGQNEELQYRNRQLEERLRQLGGGPGRTALRPPSRRGRDAPAQQPRLSAAQPRLRPAAAGYGQPNRATDRPSRAMTSSRRSPRPRRSCRSRRAAAGGRPPPRRRLRSQPESECPRRAARARRRPAADASRGGRRRARRPRCRASRSISATPVRATPAAPPPPRPPAPSAALTTLPPSATPKDEFDLGIGYMQRKDYALAEETMKNFAQKYPSDPAGRGFAILARRKLFPAPAISRRRRSLPRRDHQIRQIRQGARCAAAARPVAGGAEGKGSRLRRASAR